MKENKKEKMKSDFSKLDKHAYQNVLGNDLTSKQKEEVKRYEFTSKTKQTLAKRVGYKCSNPTCQASTVGPGDNPDDSVIIGEAAHIIGAIQDGNDKLSPRADSSVRPEYIRSIENGIWLCPKCHKLADSKTSTYTVDLLKKWKKDAEERQSKELEGSKNKTAINFSFPKFEIEDNEIDTSKFNSKDWCLLLYMISIYLDTSSWMSNSKLKFEDGEYCFKRSYPDWLQANSIKKKTSGLYFDGNYDHDWIMLSDIADHLTGLVILDSEDGLNYGPLFEDFLANLNDNDINKILKMLSVS